MGQNIYNRRLLGDQPGVQVNLPVDQTERMLPDAADQTFGTVGWFERGRIDRAFLVTPNKLKRTLGINRSLRQDQRFKTYLNIFDAFTNGAAAGVVVRLASSSAKTDFCIAAHSATASAVWTSGALPAAGTGTWLVAVKVLDCINEGVYCEIWQSTDKGSDNAALVGLRIRERNRVADREGVLQDTAYGAILYELEGSLNPAAVDENGNSNYLADIAGAVYGDALEIHVNSANAAIADTDAFAGATIGAGLSYYTDSGVLTPADYQAAVTKLKNTSIRYRRLFIDSEVLALVQALIDAAPDINRRLDIEAQGENPDAAITWKNQFNYPAQAGMYFDWIWTPQKRLDPTGVSGIAQFGSVGQHTGYWLGRNAVHNVYGMAALQQPIAGKFFYLSGAKFSQTYDPDDLEKANLAKAHINPALFNEYHDGAGVVWEDSLAGAKKNGISKLSSVCDMSVWAQDYYGRFAKSLIQLPMNDAIRKMQRFCQRTGEEMQASDWLTASESLDGHSFNYVVQRNERYPDDKMDVILNFAFNGVARKIEFTQNMYSSD